MKTEKKILEDFAQNYVKEVFDFPLSLYDRAKKGTMIWGKKNQ